MNSVTLMGNLGADAELNGKVLKFRLATTQKFTDSEGNKQERTQWHRCTMFNRENLAQYLTKGTKLLVTGRIEYSQYEKDGETKYSTDIIVSNVEFAGGGSTSTKREAAPAEENNPNWTGDDPLAFPPQ